MTRWPFEKEKRERGSRVTSSRKHASFFPFQEASTSYYNASKIPTDIKS